MFNVVHADLVSVLVQVRMCANTGVPFRHLEPLSVLHYAVGEQITEHFDFVDPLQTPDYERELAENGQRILTFLVYLNDDYEGGKTEMPAARHLTQGQKGEGLFLSIHSRTVIRIGEPCTRGGRRRAAKSGWSRSSCEAVRCSEPSAATTRPHRHDVAGVTSHVVGLRAA